MKAWTPDVVRQYHRRRRALAKKLGICQRCNDAKAAEGRSKCPDCLVIHVIAQTDRNQRKAA